MEYRWCGCLYRQIVTVCLIFTIYPLTVHSTQSLWSDYSSSQPCSSGSNLKYLSGDALLDSPSCIGPNNAPYPSAAVARTFNSNWNAGATRRGRMSQLPTLSPSVTQNVLLKAYGEANNEETHGSRYGRSIGSSECRSTPARLCKTRYNTTAPMYGVSLTSGQPVTIVQKFPDLLQQVVFEVCESSECDVVRGECTQTYVPYLFLVIPLGPVTLTGQDYVLVESGCVCKPKYATGVSQEPNIIP